MSENCRIYAINVDLEFIAELKFRLSAKKRLVNFKSNDDRN